MQTTKSESAKSFEHTHGARMWAPPHTPCHAYLVFMFAVPKEESLLLARQLASLEPFRTCSRKTISWAGTWIPLFHGELKRRIREWVKPCVFWLSLFLGLLVLPMGEAAKPFIFEGFRQFIKSLWVKVVPVWICGVAFFFGITLSGLCQGGDSIWIAWHAWDIVRAAFCVTVAAFGEDLSCVERFARGPGRRTFSSSKYIYIYICIFSVVWNLMNFE